VSKIIEVPDPNDWSGENGQFFHDVAIRHLKARGIEDPSSDQLADGYREVQDQLRQAIDDGKAKVREEPLSEAELQQLREQIISDAALAELKEDGRVGSADAYVKKFEEIRREAEGP